MDESSAREMSREAQAREDGAPRGGCSRDGGSPGGRPPEGEPPEGELPLEGAVGLLVAVADPHRLALLRALTAGPTCVCELQVQVPLPGNRLSYHLKVLREAGLITGTKRGRWIDYALVDGALDRLRAAIPRLPPGAGPLRAVGAASRAGDAGTVGAASGPGGS